MLTQLTAKLTKKKSNYNFCRLAVCFGLAEGDLRGDGGKEWLEVCTQACFIQTCKEGLRGEREGRSSGRGSDDHTELHN